MADVAGITGRHAVVTGAASGLGRAIAADLAAAGALVTAFDRSPAVTSVSVGHAAVVDCGRTDEVRAAVEAARDVHGPVSIVVHAAGIGIHQPIGEFTDAFYDATFDVHVRGLCALAAAAASDWAEHGGSLLAVTSPAAIRGQVHGSVYAAAKSAVIGFVRSAALELAPKVRVNAILPMAATPMTAEVREDAALDAHYLQRVPLRRWGTPEEIAGFCRFVLSDAGSYMTGAVLNIDGGRTI